MMVVDTNLSTLQPLRSTAGLVFTPLYWVADLPVRTYSNLVQIFSSRTELLAENEKLRSETLLIKRQLQKLALLTKQNERLRELLNSSALFEEQVLAAELLGADPNPGVRRLLLDKGSQHGVYTGQPVLDASGVVGQVVEVMPYSSRVLLLTDNSHSLPIQVTRNDLRAIASGTGNPDTLELRYITDITDIEEGDLLITSGMGGKFPSGYPVAIVSHIERNTGQPFATVHATPTADLNRSRYFLLVFSDGYERYDRSLQQELINSEAELLESAPKQGESAVDKRPSPPSADTEGVQP